MTMRRAASLVAALIFAAACGSTADDSQQGSAQPGPGEAEFATEDTATPQGGVDSTGVDAPSGGQIDGPAADADGTGSAGQAGAPAGNASAAGAAGAASSGPGRLPVGSDVHGVTDDTILIGIDHVGSYSGFGGAYGYQLEDTEETQAAQKAIIDYINKTGGIAGRTIKPVWWNADERAMFTPSTRRSEHQAACAKWTEDAKVFAMLPYNEVHEELWFDCARRTRTPLIVGANFLNARPSERQFRDMVPYWYAPASFVQDRQMRAMGRLLLSHGLNKNAKVGLVIQDAVGIREGIERGLKPVLAGAGITPAVEVVYPDILQSPWDNYILQLKVAGVTHVIFSSTTGIFFPSVFMMRAAENQQYRPKWLMGGDHFPGAYYSLQSPRAQMDNVEGVAYDTYQITNDQTAQTPTARTCWDIAKAAGYKQQYSGRITCEALFFMRAAFEHAEELSAEGLARGVARLGNSYVSVHNFAGASLFGPGRHDGVSLGRYFSFDRNCDYPNAPCLKFVSGPEPLGQ